MPLLKTFIIKAMIFWEAPPSSNTALNHDRFHAYNNAHFPMLILLPCRVLLFYV